MAVATKNKQQWVTVEKSKFTVTCKVDVFQNNPWKSWGWFFLVYRNMLYIFQSEFLLHTKKKLGSIWGGTDYSDISCYIWYTAMKFGPCSMWKLLYLGEQYRVIKAFLYFIVQMGNLKRKIDYILSLLLKL